MPRAYNFSPGPAMLPESVLRQAQATMLEYGDAGASILEISHRGADFLAVAHQAEADLRTLLAIPDEYAVLFTSGGATTVQALLPLNFAAPGQPCDYVVSGHWGKTALKQAAPCGHLSLHSRWTSASFSRASSIAPLSASASPCPASAAMSLGSSSSASR